MPRNAPSYDDRPASQSAGASTRTFNPSLDDTVRPRELPQTISRYRISRMLGTGSFGTVYLASDPVLQRNVALKVPRRSECWSETEADSFLEEARAAARLQHPNAVTVYEVGRSETQGVFVAMEFVEGETLAQRLARGPLEPKEAARMVACVARAVHSGHRQGMVHRDLKPGNILLDSSGEPKVSDFGLAVREDAQRQCAGEVSGTPAYMSPEQVRGEAHFLDGRSDVWSLGVILYECLTGRRPFRGRDFDEVSVEILGREPKPLRQIDDRLPKLLDELCLRCLRKNPADRMPTALDLARELDRFTEEAIGRRSPVRTVLMVLLGTALLGTALLVFTSRLEPERPEPPKSAGIDSRPPALPPTRQAVPIGSDLLSRSPREIVFGRGDPLSHYSYLEHERRFIVRAAGWGCFAVGEPPGPDFELSVSAQVQQEWRGRGGVLWGLHLDPDDIDQKRYFCLGAVVAWDQLKGRYEMRLYHLTVEESALGDLHVRTDWRLADIPLHVNTRAPLTFRLTIASGKPVLATVQGQEVALDVERAPVPWDDFSDGEIGIVCFNGEMVFTRASVRNLRGGSDGEGTEYR